MSNLGKLMNHALYYGKAKRLPDVEPKTRCEISEQGKLTDCLDLGRVALVALLLKKKNYFYQFESKSGSHSCLIMTPWMVAH